MPISSSCCDSRSRPQATTPATRDPRTHETPAGANHAEPVPLIEQRHAALALANEVRGSVPRSSAASVTAPSRCARSCRRRRRPRTGARSLSCCAARPAGDPPGRSDSSHDTGSASTSRSGS